MAQSVTLTTDGLLLNWLKEVGDAVKAGDVIAEVEADKATVEIEAGSDGVILELKADVGEELSEGAVIATIGGEGEKPSNGKAQQQEKAPAKAKAEDTADEAPEEAETEEAPAAQKAGSNGADVAARTPDGRIKVSPVARKLAEDKGIDLSQVQGSGPGGRIVKSDVEDFTPSAAPSRSSAAQPAPGGRQTYGKLPEGPDVEIIDVSRMRRAIADSTILSKQMTPHFYVTAEMDVAALLDLRKELNTSLEAEGVKISVNDMVVKAAALALRKFPNLNSHYYGDKIVRHKRINIGISVALPNNGLINVVCQDADKKALSTIAAENKAMYDRAREGKIKPEDTKGATFTISNLGPYNITHFAAIISPPEAGILAVGSAQKVPIVKEDGSLGVGNRMNVTVAVDHRVSDGAEGAEYLNALRDLIENPMRLLV